MSSLSGWRRFRLLIGGALLGLLLAGVAVWVWVQTARDIELRTAVGRELGLPPDAFELEEVREGRLRISLRSVALLDPGGDTIVSAPLAHLLLDQVDLGEGAAVVIPQAELIDPFLRLVQRPDGEWNLVQAVALMTDGQEVQVDAVQEGRAVLLREVRLVRGRALVSMLAEGEPQVRTVRAVDARLANVRVGGPEGWRVEVADLSAILEDPDVRIAQLRGWAEEAPEDGIRFALETLRTDLSEVTGEGLVRFAADRTLLDAQLQAGPLDLRDLRWFAPELPLEGQARFAALLESRPDARTAIAVRDLELVGLDSRVEGRLAMVVAENELPVFYDTNLRLDPLDLRILEAFGLAEQFPYAGQIRGTLATLEPVTGAEGPLRVDLVASVTPRDLPGIEPSIIAAEGALALREELAGTGLEALRIQLRPLQLAALRPLLPEQEQWLQGVLRGVATLTGTMRELQIGEGELVYEVGDAPPTRLAAISGRVQMEPELRYELSAVARPLELVTLTELFPVLPFRRANLTGPVEVTGTAEDARFSVDLGGDAGMLAMSGSLAFTDPLRFDVSGLVQAFQPGGLLLREMPTVVGLSGSFAVAGTTEDLAFTVDLTQAEGSFALDGRIRPAVEPVEVEVAGRVVDFQLGPLIGRPGLFASALTGDVRVEGGGLRAYAFDLDLRGPQAALDVEGWYVPAEVPAYALSGVIAGLNPRRLPGFEELPAGNLVARVQLEGQGTTPETVAGRLALDAAGTTVGGVPFESATAELAAAAGILQVQTLAASLRGVQLTAAGAWGLTRPAPEPLHYTLDAPNLAALTPILVAMRRPDIQIAGSLFVDGWIAGTLEQPQIALVSQGRNLRYDGWRAATLALEGEARLDPAGWSGQGNLAAANATVVGTETFQTIRLEAVAQPGAASVGAVVRRDAETELAGAGVLELDPENQLQGIALETLALRLGPGTWQLAERTRLRWGGVEGIEIDNLQLRRTGVAEGWIEIDGRLPPTGAVDLRVRAAGVDLRDMQRLVRTAPLFEGVVALDAVLEGPVGAPELAVTARIDDLRFEDARADTVLLSARYAAGRMEVTHSAWAAEQRLIVAEASIPMLLSIEEMIPQVELLDPEPVAARLVADSLPLGLVIAAVPQATDGAGAISGEIEVTGTLGRPVMTGSAALAGGALTLPELNVRYREIEGRLALEDEEIRIESLTARSAGAAALSGRIRIDDRTSPDLALAVTLEQFRPINRPDLATVAMTGSLGLSGRLPNPVLTGRLSLSDGVIGVPGMEDRAVFDITDIEIGEIGPDTIPTLALEPTILDNIRIDGLEVAIGDAVWAESPELRVQLGGELLVSRRGAETWQVFGDLQALRGTYSLRVGPILRAFDIVSGRIQFFGTPDLNPALNIVAAHRVREMTRAGAGAVLNILVQVSGTAQFPRIALTTDTRPPLPESELISYLIFGRPSFALGDLGGQLEQLVVQEAVGAIVLAPVEQWLRQVGLFDYVRVRGRPGLSELGTQDALGATTVEVGWQLRPDLFLTAEWGVGTGFEREAIWGTSLEWQIDPKWSARIANEPLLRDRQLQWLATGLEFQRQWSLDLRRRWEYGHPRLMPAPGEVVGEPQTPGPVAVPDAEQPNGEEPDVPE